MGCDTCIAHNLGTIVCDAPSRHAEMNIYKKTEDWTSVGRFIVLRIDIGRFDARVRFGVVGPRGTTRTANHPKPFGLGWNYSVWVWCRCWVLGTDVDCYGLFYHHLCGFHPSCFLYWALFWQLKSTSYPLLDTCCVLLSNHVPSRDVKWILMNTSSDCFKSFGQ